MFSISDSVTTTDEITTKSSITSTTTSLESNSTTSLTSANNLRKSFLSSNSTSGDDIQPPVPTPVRWVSLNTLPTYREDDDDDDPDNIPISPPKLFSAKSTPVYSSLTKLQRNELTVDDISAHRIRRSMIHSGQQVLSSRMLRKIAQESDTDTTDTPTTTKEIEEEAPSAPDKKSEDVDTQLTLSELIEIIVNEKEVIPFLPPETEQDEGEKKDDSPAELRCCSCYDDLVLSKAPNSDATLAVYVCKVPDCPGALCDNCLLRQVDITISNALYAVPKIRCPGTCSGRIPTALWRGVLQGMPAPTASNDNAAKKSTSELVQGVVAAYDLFSRNFEESYLDELSSLFDSIVEVLSSCNLTLVDVYNQAYDLNMIPPVESQAEAEEPARHKINSFSVFASSVFPSAPEPVFHSSGLFRTNRLTDQLDAYIQGDIANLAGQSGSEGLDATVCQTIFCFFLAELAVCLRFRDRVLPFVESYEGRSKNSAETSLIKKYSDNAEGLMAMRCGSCHRTTGLNFSEKNNKQILKELSDRETTLNDLLRPLSTRLSHKLLKSWVDFNNAVLSPLSFVQIIRSCELKSRQSLKYAISQDVCCPRGHSLVETPNSNNIFLPACGASSEAVPCTHAESPELPYYRCPTCPFRYCGLCYHLRRDALITLQSTFKDKDDEEDDNGEEKDDLQEAKDDTNRSMRYNYDGIPTFVAEDNIHTHTSRHYCGRYVRTDRYDRTAHLNCALCTGTCGPNGGCQCKACAALDPADVIEEVAGLLSDDGWQFAEKILSLLTDPERRFVLQLELLRQFPKIKTPCCTREHCFMCKVQGHHEGRTCEEVQRDSYGVECQFCPGCGVPTVKTEGCSHIICPCGRHWQWSSDSGSAFGGGSIFSNTTTAPNPFAERNPFSEASSTANSNPFANPSVPGSSNTANGGHALPRFHTFNVTPIQANLNGNNSTINNQSGGFGSSSSINNNSGPPGFSLSYNSHTGGFTTSNNRNTSNQGSASFGAFTTPSNHPGGFTSSFGNNNNNTLTSGFGSLGVNNSNSNNNMSAGFGSNNSARDTGNRLFSLHSNNNNRNNPYAPQSMSTYNNTNNAAAFGAFGNPSPPFHPSMSYPVPYPLMPFPSGGMYPLATPPGSLVPGYYLYSTPYGIYQVPGYLSL